MDGAARGDRSPRRWPDACKLQRSGDTRRPAGFPFPNAIQRMWSVVYVEAVAPGRTRVREVSLGFDADEESQKMREFFNQGNATTLKRLQSYFAKVP